MEDRYEQVPEPGQHLVHEEKPPEDSVPDLATDIISILGPDFVLVDACWAAKLNSALKRIESLEAEVEALKVEQENLDETLFMMRRGGEWE